MKKLVSLLAAAIVASLSLVTTGCNTDFHSNTLYTLTVNSTNPVSGVSIGVSQPDITGATTGSTSFARAYAAGASVTLTAPASAGGNSFSSWTGCTSSNRASCKVTLSANTTVTAVYMTALITPTVTVTPSPASITTTQALTVTVNASGGSDNPTPSGSVVLTSGSYTSAATTLTSGGATITIPAGSLGTGTDALTATYTPDSSSSATYSSATGTASVIVATNSSGIIGDCGMDENGAGTGQVDYVEVYSSQYAKWCVDTTYWAANQQYISQFFSYYDGAVAQLISLFNLQPSLPIVVEVTTPTGGACDCGPKFGEQQSVVITGDAYSDTFNNPQNNQAVPGFWGYLLTLHETINAFTGTVSGGWPTDWWADHRSPFPNAMDEHVMKYIGTQQNNQTLLNAAQAQHERFADPSISGYDSEVAMFDNFFNQYGGFTAYSKFFQLVEEDKLSWPSVSQDSSDTGDNNYSTLLSEYVAAYLSMAFGTTSDLTSTFTGAGVGTLDTTEPSYTMSSAAVLGVANAHCSIRSASGAGISVTSQLSQLQGGNYQNAVASGGEQSTCPSECSWNGSQCAAKW
ncbi:MAG: hypothetical protein ABSE51_22545 [Terracidiphilus sp.]